MRDWLLALAATLAVAFSGFMLAQQPATSVQATAGAAAKSPTAQPDLAALLEGKVRAAWEAFKKRDKNAYAKFLADDFQAVEADGEGERSRLHVLGEVEHCMYTSYLLQLFQVQPLGADYAFVTYESTMQFPKTATLRYRRVFIGELWTKRDHEWKMMRYQETLVR